MTRETQLMSAQDLDQLVPNKSFVATERGKRLLFLGSDDVSRLQFAHRSGEGRIDVYYFDRDALEFRGGKLVVREIGEQQHYYAQGNRTRGDFDYLELARLMVSGD